MTEGREPIQDKMKSLITNIKLDAATFHGETVEPTYINFFFGKNDAGKTTVASAFEDPSCLEWKSRINPADYTILGYNQEFINRNFANYGDLKGVFTLSKENAETRKQIDDKTEERKTVIADGKQAADNCDKKGGEFKMLRDSFETTCWEDSEDIRRRPGRKRNSISRMRYFQVSTSLSNIKKRTYKNYMISPMIQGRGNILCLRHPPSSKASIILPASTSLLKKLPAGAKYNLYSS